MGRIPSLLDFVDPSYARREQTSSMASVFVFNPFAEGHLARGKAFTPVKHQAMLAADLANLPQYLCEEQDVVLLPRRPSASFLQSLSLAGFRLPDFVELRNGQIDPDSALCRGQFGSLRPWAWGPDSVELFAPLFSRTAGGTRTAHGYFNERVARLYSKAWSACFLRKVLSSWESKSGVAGWLCPHLDTGIAADTLDGALAAIATIRDRGHARVVVKEALGLAGSNALRLWERELLPTQRKWLEHALNQGRQLVVEPWLERALDFSVQLEMEPGGLKPCGYTGMLNDRRGQYLANWAEPGFARCLPASAAPLFHRRHEVAEPVHALYESIRALLEGELRLAGFLGPVSIDSFVYRTREGDCRLKPVVEINPRYTMGRVTVELMKHVQPGKSGWFHLVNRSQARRAGFPDFPNYARALRERFPLIISGDPPVIHQGALCLSEPDRAQACLAAFVVTASAEPPGPLGPETPARGE